MNDKIRRGDRVNIKKEWRDDGDNEFIWIACDNEEKGRVTIAPINTGFAIVPRQTVDVNMLEIDNDELVLESYTMDEITAEDEARRRRSIMAAGIARRLTGSAGDLTSDIFGEGETPLFNSRR